VIRLTYRLPDLVVRQGRPVEQESKMNKTTCWPLGVVVTLALAATAAAQEPHPAGAPAPPAAAAPEAEAEGTGWEFGLSGALYILPDEGDFVQPTLRADRRHLHLETRYNYEDRDSTSFFVGANLELGDKVKLALTPMLGGLVGQTDGIIPALEADLTVGPFEAYAEAEYVFDLDDSSSKYFYMWSELSVWPTEWLRAGMVTQRTRVYQTERDIQRGLLVGFSFKKAEGTVYFFNPGSDDHFTVVSLGVSF
jgi:hypothetical protein